MSINELFRLMDDNDDGLISAPELNTHLDKLIKLSQPIKDGLFALMDTNSLGLVD